MELELTVRGTADEIRQVLDVMSASAERTGMAPPVLTETVERFVSELSHEGTTVLRIMVRGALGDPDLPNGATEQKIEQELGKSPYGVIGGLARRWAAMQGPTFDPPPFRKQGEGKSGRYRLPRELAEEINHRLPDIR